MYFLIESATYFVNLGDAPPVPPPSEENITFLVSMGFNRERVIRALQSTGGNVEAATNLLLQDPWMNNQ